MADDLRVVAVSIHSLFGLYDHQISFNQVDRVTIIHGPNGVGKTIILKCLAALFSGRFYVLRSTPFDSFQVRLNDGSEIIIRRFKRTDAEPAVESGPDFALEVQVFSEGKSVKADLKTSADVTEMARRVERESHWLVPISEHVYMDQRLGRQITAEEVVQRYLPRSRLVRLGRLRSAEPDALRKLRDRVKVKFIETNRLVQVVPPDGPPFEFGGATLTNTVNDYAKELHVQIEMALTQYGRQSQALDQSFPQRLIREDVAPLELVELKTRLEKLEQRQKTLSEIGLLDSVPTRPFDTSSLDFVSDAKLVPMTLYLQDSEAKISVFNSLAGRAQLLLDSANRKFRNKKLVINRESGLTAVGLQGEPLSLDSLSSGEQHEIVLLFELLFNISPNTLVLIDEPELSLHVTWQKLFLPEILSVSAKIGFDVVIATHSPFIVGGRRDLMVPLDAEPDNFDESAMGTPSGVS